MIKIAIVEDQKNAAQLLENYINRYGEEQNHLFQVTRFLNALAFLNPYQGFDLVFMDIQLPFMDGLSVAKKLREIDSQVTLIFVTNMAQYAVRGYEVEALDFVIKPVAYSDFTFKMKRALKTIALSNKNKIAILYKGDMVSFHSDEVEYVEVRGHNLIYHVQGKEYQVRGTMKKVQDQFAEWNFLRCNNCYLVNPHHIQWVKDYMVKVGNDELQISHPRKKQFMKELSTWYAKGGK